MSYEEWRSRVFDECRRRDVSLADLDVERLDLEAAFAAGDTPAEAVEHWLWLSEPWRA